MILETASDFLYDSGAYVGCRLLSILVVKIPIEAHNAYKREIAQIAVVHLGREYEKLLDSHGIVVYQHDICGLQCAYGCRFWSLSGEK
jgi:hypothetical protein